MRDANLALIFKLNGKRGLRELMLPNEMTDQLYFRPAFWGKLCLNVQLGKWNSEQMNQPQKKGKKQ